MKRETYIWCDSRDSAGAAQTAHFLESVGISTWDPVNGEKYQTPKGEVLDHSHLVLVLWSQHAKASELALLLKIAIGQTKLIVPVTLDGSEPLEDLGVEPSDYVWHDLTENTRQRWQQVAKVITRRLATRNNQTDMEKGLNAVRLALTTFATQGPRTIRDACKILMTAIDHGAPIYNAGDLYGCARIYEMAAKALQGAIVNHALKPSGEQAVILNDIQRITGGHGYASSENAYQYAWDLRYAFDALLENCYQTTVPGAIDAIDSRFETIAQPTSGDIRRLFQFAISEGAPLYNDGCHRECAAIYLRAAFVAITLEQRDREKNSSRSEFFDHARRLLTSVLLEYEVPTTDPANKYNWALDHRASKFAWDLRHAFEGILEYGYSLNDSVGGSAELHEQRIKADTTEKIAKRPIFISYARSDNASDDPRHRWLDRLQEHLRPLVRQGEMEVWSDQDLEIGDFWRTEIQKRLMDARAAVLLISPAFLASEYIANSELPILLKRASEGGLTIVPVLVSPSLYHKVSFKYPDPKTGPEVIMLSDIQAANPPSRTLEELSLPDQNKVLSTVAEQLFGILARNV